MIEGCFDVLWAHEPYHVGGATVCGVLTSPWLSEFPARAYADYGFIRCSCVSSVRFRFA